MIRESKDCTIQTDRTKRLQHLLDAYADVFEAPPLGHFRDFTPERVRVHNNSIPPNRPPFRLSMSGRKEVGKQVQ
jgi:hypothetical protein